METNTQSVFTPSGGMNQDDSLLTPTQDAGGHSPFANGDYRYALNARIGSSRSNNFGDLENLKDSVEVESYNVFESLVENPDFTSTLSPWLQIGGGDVTWAYSANAARITTALTGTVTTDVLYQEITTISRRIVVKYDYFINEGFSNGIELYLVFLNSTTEISTQRINPIGYTQQQIVSLIVDLPENCDGVGIKFIANTTDPSSSISLDYLRINGWVSGTRPVGDERVIGKLEDREFLRIFYAVYNSNGDHCIRYYDKVNDSVYELIKWNGLNFGSTYFVSMAKIDNWLGITDRNNRPRLIDTDTIHDLFLTLGSNFREFHISFHKFAPVMPPVLRNYYDGSTNNYDRFKNKYFQVSYRYIYNGNLKSRWSPHSYVAEQFAVSGGNITTAIEIYMPGIFYDDPASAIAYNYFDHQHSKFTNAVKYIEVAYRDGDNNIWRLIKRISVVDGSNQILRFDGSSSDVPIPEDDMYQLFDAVPLKSGCIEAIDNRFVFADILDEYPAASDPVLTDIGVVSWGQPFPSNTYWHSTSAASFSSLSVAQAADLTKRNIINDMTFKARGLYKVGIQYMAADGWVSGTYTTDAWIYRIPDSSSTTDGEYALTFKFASSFKPPEWAVAYQIVRTEVLNFDYFMFGLVNEFQPLIDDVSAINDLENLPASLRTAIINHFDNSKNVMAEDVNKYIEKKGFLNRVIFNRNKYLESNFIWRKTGPELRQTTTVSLVDDASRIYINCDNWYNASKKNSSGTTNNPINKLFYNYKEGDRVRFVASNIATPSQSQKQVYDVEILEFTGRAIIVEKPEDVLWLPKNGDAYTLEATDYIIEVYTPRHPSEDNYIFYECGEWYPVLYPLTPSRDWSKSDWTYANNAAVTGNDYGDVTVFNKYPFTQGDCHFLSKQTFFNLKTSGLRFVTVRSSCMTNNKDEVFGVWNRGNGRPSVAYDTLPVDKFIPTKFIFSGKIIEQSMVNALNRVRPEDGKIFPSEYGRVRAMVNTSNAQVESVGSILLAIGEREAWSIYVNRTTLEDLSGNTQVAISDKVLGSYNTLLGSHGTLNPESVSKERGNVYWWDALDGSWIRYGRNGLTEISSYKMRTWFREISNLIIDQYMTDTPPTVISEIDCFNEELITHIDHSSMPETFRGYSNYKGVLFSEKDTRWKSCHNYNPEMLAKLGTLVISFYNGSVVKHEVGDGYNTLLGTKRDVMIEPVFNISPMDAKHWFTISYIATDKWSVDRILSEYRGLKPLLQSRILIDQFELREDRYWASIKGDLNTPNIAAPIINGDPIRCRAAQVLFKMNPDITYLSLLHYAMAGAEESPKNA